jgi:hypothetical protein
MNLFGGTEHLAHFDFFRREARRIPSARHLAARHGVPAHRTPSDARRAPRAPGDAHAFEQHDGHVDASLVYANGCQELVTSRFSWGATARRARCVRFSACHSNDIRQSSRSCELRFSTLPACSTARSRTWPASTTRAIAIRRSTAVSDGAGGRSQSIASSRLVRSSGACAR